MTTPGTSLASNFLRAPYDRFDPCELDGDESLSPAQKEEVEGKAHLIFNLADSSFALSTAYVAAVLTTCEPQRIPFVETHHCLGFTVFRGKAIPVLDLLGIMQLQTTNEVRAESRTVIIHQQGLFSAFEVDRVIGVERSAVFHQPWREDVSAPCIRFGAREKTALVLDSRVSSLIEKGPPV